MIPEYKPNFNEVAKLADGYRSAETHYEKALRCYLGGIDLGFQKYVKAGEGEFWEFIDKVNKVAVAHKYDSKLAFSEAVRSYLFDGRHRACCCSCHEEATKEEAKKQPSEADKWQKLAVFCAMYADYVVKIGKAIRHMDGLDRGDDGFSDLCDSLPLAGKSIVEQLLSRTILTYKGLKDEMPGTGNATGQLTTMSKFILEGENYCHTAFVDALAEYLPSIAADIMEEEEAK